MKTFLLINSDSQFRREDRFFRVRDCSNRVQSTLLSLQSRCLKFSRTYGFIPTVLSHRFYSEVSSVNKCIKDNEQNNRVETLSY